MYLRSFTLPFQKAKWQNIAGSKKSLIAGAASKLGAAATKKKGGLASRLSKMQKDASFGPTSSLGVCSMYSCLILR